MPDTHANLIHQEYYTKNRWNNWIEQVKKSDINFQDSEEKSEKEGAIFVNMEDDLILACLKVIAKYDHKTLTPEEGMEILSSIHEIVLEETEPISGDVDMMIESLQTSFMGALAACECYLNNAYNEDTKIEDLIAAAIEAEENEDAHTAMGYVAEIGANILNGSSLPTSALEDISYGLVAEWLDGIESIEAAMIGADSYKEDDDKA
ncbi:MAG: DUF2150 family protein [Methanosarcinaceae archaeon]|nr:DUF2150 family protein [Methanosarcinaceae archaeon]